VRGVQKKKIVALVAHGDIEVVMHLAAARGAVRPPPRVASKRLPHRSRGAGGGKAVGQAGGGSDGRGDGMSGGPDGQSIGMGCWNGLGVWDGCRAGERDNVQCNGWPTTVPGRRAVGRVGGGADGRGDGVGRGLGWVSGG
jgi:hypothetical protein